MQIQQLAAHKGQPTKSNGVCSHVADPHVLLMDETSLENTFTCQPQQRNMHGRIFGGFLMRWVGAHMSQSRGGIFLMPQLWRLPHEVGAHMNPWKEGRSVIVPGDSGREVLQLYMAVHHMGRQLPIC